MAFLLRPMQHVQVEKTLEIVKMDIGLNTLDMYLVNMTRDLIFRLPLERKEALQLLGH